MTPAYRRRLPGLRCDPAVPPTPDDAVRLDVAGFVGFAERGPVAEPVPVEDPAQYADVFGGDLPLALDDGGVPVHAALPDAVRSFFACGGRRAWVVRVTGPGARVLPLPTRVVSRHPLGRGDAVVGLRVAPGPGAGAPSAAGALGLVAASPGGWAGEVRVEVDVTDTVLTLEPGPAGAPVLAAASRRSVGPGDVLLLDRGGVRAPLAVTTPDPAPAGGWVDGDVVRLLRADVAVRRVRDGVATTLERLAGLRLGPSGDPGAPGWSDAVQPPGTGFRADRSRLLRAPGGGTWAWPVLGPRDAALPPAPSSSPAPFTAAALATEGLASCDVARLFLDGALRGHTVDGLRRALEELGLDDGARPAGIHALARIEEVALVAVPDLYHRPWTEQVVRLPGEPDPEPDPGPEPPRPVTPGFRDCAVEPFPASPLESPLGSPPGTLADPPPDLRMVLDPPAAYSRDGALEVAGELARLCAARGDLVAVLGLPRHAGLAEAAAWVDGLIAAVGEPPAAGVPDPLSYAGLWHPWGAVAEPRSPALAPLRPVPPDGAVCGTIARSELDRGLWVEPAGRLLAGWLAVDPVRDAGAVDLLDAGVNVVLRGPDGIVATSAHSLAGDPALGQLSVRRLLIATREIALREGARFVFEPDTPRFRALLATVLSRALEAWRDAGALVAYEVTVADLAGRPAADEGRTRIDLALAPSTPVEYLTVSLLRAGQELREAVGAR